LSISSRRIDTKISRGARPHGSGGLSRCIRSSATPSGSVVGGPTGRKPAFSRTRMEPMFWTAT